MRTIGTKAHNVLNDLSSIEDAIEEIKEIVEIRQYNTNYNAPNMDRHMVYALMRETIREIMQNIAASRSGLENLIKIYEEKV